MDSGPNIVLLGLPEAGKTTFLAAFIHTVDSRHDVNLKQYKLSSNTSYTNAIVQDWLKAKKTERTKITASNTPNTDAEIFLEQKSTGKKFTLSIPDFYGEIFETQFVDRLVQNDYISMLSGCVGMLLFINPEKIIYPTLIEDINGFQQIADAIDSLQLDKEETFNNSMQKTNHDEQLKIEPFEIEKSPTQVILVDLLEAQLYFLKRRSLKVSILISAWDVVQNTGVEISPMKWVEINTPLLYQFLIGNNDKFKFKVFGVSAQGGNVEDESEFERLTALNDPSERIIVQADEEDSNITSTIEWIINDN